VPPPHRRRASARPPPPNFYRSFRPTSRSVSARRFRFSFWGGIPLSFSVADRLPLIINSESRGRGRRPDTTPVYSRVYSTLFIPRQLNRHDGRPGQFFRQKGPQENQGPKIRHLHRQYGHVAGGATEKARETEEGSDFAAEHPLERQR